MTEGAWLRIDARGVPVQKGTIQTTNKGGAYWREGKALKQWEAAIAAAATEAMEKNGLTILDGPIFLCATFWMKRPKARKTEFFHTVRPDLDKLFRAVGDALQGIVYEDDKQISQIDSAKVYEGSEALLPLGPITLEEPGVIIYVAEMPHHE